VSGKLIDVSLLVRPDMHFFDGDPRMALDRVLSLDDGDPANVSLLSCGVHTGTHVDAPLHFIPGGSGADRLDVDALAGPALVVDLRQLDGDIDTDALADVDLDGVERVLFATRNSWLWALPSFTMDFVSIAPSAASLLVEKGIRLVGVDYLSVGSPETHRILLGADVVCVEGLDLSAVPAGHYEMFCGPVKLQDADGAPARVLLRQT
jgi:arylformamidase